MKKLILGLVLISGSAFADIRECADTLDSMAKLTTIYADVLKSCRALERAGDTSGRAYEGHRRIARGAEQTYSQARDLCDLVCDDTFFCESELSGACTQ